MKERSEKEGRKSKLLKNLIWLFVIAGCFLLAIRQGGFHRGTWNALFWLYFSNCALLSYYCIWNELEVFGLGLDGSIVLLIALLFVSLYGLVRIEQGMFTGLIFSLVLGLIGIFAFSAYMLFTKKDTKEPVSLFILAAALIISLIQMAIAIYFLNKGDT